MDTELNLDFFVRTHLYTFVLKDSVGNLEHESSRLERNAFNVFSSQEPTATLQDSCKSNAIL